MALEKLALKRSSNNEGFECVNKAFDGVLQNSGSKEQKDRYNFIRTILGNCTRILKIQKTKLKIKSESFKQEWSTIPSRIKNGSGLALEKEPHWWKYLNPTFSE